LASPLVVSFVIYLIVYIFNGFRKRNNDDKISYDLGEENNPNQSECNAVISMCCNKSRAKENDVFVIFALLLLIAIHLFAFSFHRSMGGHQFGARYTVDTLPAFYLGLLLMLKQLPKNNTVYLNIPPMIFGLLLNFQGTVTYMSYYFQ
jgi:hypothetical protein